MLFGFATVLILSLTLSVDGSPRLQLAGCIALSSRLLKRPFMDKIAAGPASDRRDLFRESASRLGMNPAIVEKDFWVCWILKLLFAEPALKNQTVFKGGTSLSKVFGLIDRFSEDVDLVLDRLGSRRTWFYRPHNQHTVSILLSVTVELEHRDP
jgi:hypothetical protein